MGIINYFKGWAMPSANGQGRTLWEIITGANKKKMGPIEFQYHNPFNIKVGNSVTFQHDLKLGGINFFVEAIQVDKTKFDTSSKTFTDTEYVLKGLALGMTKPKRVRLRVSPWEDSADPKFPYKINVLELYHQQDWDQGLFDYLNKPQDGIFQINEDDDGKPLDVPRQYWRVEDAVDSYNLFRTILKDQDNNGTVEENELTHEELSFWDFSRMTEDENDPEQKIEEFINVEMNKDTKYFTMFRGKEVQPFQVSII